jgi:hypothetical protein
MVIWVGTFANSDKTSLFPTNGPGPVGRLEDILSLRLPFGHTPFGFALASGFLD